MTRIVKSGKGWRIGWNPEADLYKGLVGDDNWAIELTQAELNDFCRLLLQLSESIEQIATELMDEERITCEAQTDLLWLEAEGYPHAYCLRLILEGERRCEGYWSEAAVPNLIAAAISLRVF